MPVYRFELSPNARAVCKNKGCKDQAVKIQKGELRFATMITIRDHDSWVYRHWNCVTPDQWSNIKHYLEDLGGSYDYLDGYDEVDGESQNRIRQALEDGKVPDDEWRHEPELNVPGGRRKATPKKKKAQEGEDGAEGPTHDGDTTPSKPKKRSRKPKAKAESDDTDEPEPDEPAEPKPKKKSATKKRKAAADDEDVGPSTPPPKSKAKKTKTEPVEEEAEPVVPAKKSRAKKVKAEGQDPTVPSTKLKAKKVKTEDAEEAPLHNTAPANKKSRAARIKSEPAVDDDDDADMPAPVLAKNKKEKAQPKSKSKVKAEPEGDDDGNADGIEDEAATGEANVVVPKGKKGRSASGTAKEKGRKAR